MTNLCILTGSRAGSNIITNRARALTARRADRRVDARLTTKSISQLPADIRNGSSVSELLLEHAARALCYTWRSGPFFGLDNSRVTGCLNCLNLGCKLPLVLSRGRHAELEMKPRPINFERSGAPWL